MNIIEESNKSYYNEEEPILTDHEFDLLSDNGLEIKNFRNKTDHFQPMGSLKKIKTSGKYLRWLGGEKEILISPKLDGNSIEVVCENNKIIRAVTRGDGFVGNDITDRIGFCNFQIPEVGEKVSLKCEAIMPKKFQGDYDKNIRNVVGGILGRQSIVVEELGKIDIMCFENLEETLRDPTFEKLENIFNDWKKSYPYEIDGIVVRHLEKIYPEKDELIPENVVALKFNKEGIPGIIGSVEWNLGRYGYLTPVLILQVGIEIDGTMVKRISASNYGLVLGAGLWTGAEVKVIKSGDIIPFISEITRSSESIQEVRCPQCNLLATISENGVHAICDNCKSDQLVLLKHIFGVFDLEFISDSTIESLYAENYTNIVDYFNITVDEIKKIPGFGKSKASNIISRLKKLELTEAKVLKCAMVEGLGERQCQKLIDHFGSIDNFLGNSGGIEKIEGFGEILSGRVTKNIGKFRDIYDILRNYCKILKNTSSISKGSVVFTGTCNKYNRKELGKIISDFGYKIQDNVNRDTTILITSDPDSISGKAKKARALGIQIMTYEEFFKNVN